MRKQFPCWAEPSFHVATDEMKNSLAFVCFFWFVFIFFLISHSSLQSSAATELLGGLKGQRAGVQPLWILSHSGNVGTSLPLGS